MYSRSYPNDEAIRIPENYDGTSLLENEMPSASHTVAEPARIDLKISPRDAEPAEPIFAESDENASGGGFLSGLFGDFKLPFLKNLFSHGEKRRLTDFIGLEEILILILAAFLLFSKSGDKECAIILALLIFVK